MNKNFEMCVSVHELLGVYNTNWLERMGTMTRNIWVGPCEGNERGVRRLTLKIFHNLKGSCFIKTLKEFFFFLKNILNTSANQQGIRVRIIFQFISLDTFFVSTVLFVVSKSFI